MTIGYHRAVAADAPEIDLMLRALADHDGGTIRGSVDSLIRHGFGPAPLFRAVLARDGSEALGLCLFFPEYSSWRGRVGLFVQDLYVAPTARGQGLGKGLIAAAWAEAADWDPGFVTLMVQHRNTTARQFYEAQGFVLREMADLMVLEGEALRRLTA